MGFIQHLFDVLGKVTKAQQHRWGRSGVFAWFKWCLFPHESIFFVGGFFHHQPGRRMETSVFTLEATSWTKRQNSPTTRTPEGGRWKRGLISDYHSPEMSWTCEKSGGILQLQQKLLTKNTGCVWFSKNKFCRPKIIPPFLGSLGSGCFTFGPQDGVSPTCVPSEICIFANLHFVLINVEPLCQYIFCCDINHWITIWKKYACLVPMLPTACCGGPWCDANAG